ncbi:MAG: helix-turn-helix domain-containing protein [Alphaproteobacteria bacterium]|nr:helix-turn-helix domain-containing protein [Alphaproteobacteria bacterium]
MRDLGIETSGGGLTRQVSDSIAFGPGLVLQGTRMHFRRNEEVFGQGEAADYVYRVVSGAVRTIRFSSDGRRQILNFYLPGDVFGLECGKQHTLSAEAVADADLSLVRRSLIDTAATQDAAAARALIAMVQRQLQNAQEHALVLGRKGAGERVAAFLLQLADRVTAQCEIDLPMSRADIADYLALTIETVSRAFTQMERDHTIALPSSRHVVVRDRCALELLEAA